MIKIDFGNTALKLFYKGRLEVLPYSVEATFKLPASASFYVVSVRDEQFVLGQLATIFPSHRGPIYIAIVTDRPGLKCMYDQAVLGSDRWAAALGAAVRYQNALVVDAGTALTVDVIENGHFTGGIIVPGFQLLQTSLIAGTDKINVGSEQATIAPAQETSQAVSNGAITSMVGAVSMMMEARVELRKILVTGGDGNRLLPFLAPRFICEYDQFLVFKGMDEMEFRAIR